MALPHTSGPLPLPPSPLAITPKCPSEHHTAAQQIYPLFSQSVANRRCVHVARSRFAHTSRSSLIFVNIYVNSCERPVDMSADKESERVQRRQLVSTAYTFTLCFVRGLFVERSWSRYCVCVAWRARASNVAQCVEQWELFIAASSRI